jgi:uncharacterized protein YegL
MAGSKLLALNAAIENCIHDIKEIAEENAEGQIKIAVLEFSSGADWMTSHPIDIENFCWHDITGTTNLRRDFGAACEALNEKLSVKAFMRTPYPHPCPIIVLFSDGDPTDEYKKPLADLRQNRWFKRAVKSAVAIGDYVNKDILMEFTGSMEAVLDVHHASSLGKFIFWHCNDDYYDDDDVLPPNKQELDGILELPELPPNCINVPMEFIDILKKLVDEHGKDIFLEPIKCKSFLSDYTKNEYKKERRWLFQALEFGTAKAIHTSSELELCKKQQIRDLHEELGLDSTIATDVVTILMWILRGAEFSDDDNW